MNLYDQELMKAPSLQPAYCIICGRQNPTSHHVVPRARGGHKGPQLHLCGHGTRGCHGMAEDKKLHFRYEDGWQYLETPHPMKYETALETEGWKYVDRCNA